MENGTNIQVQNDFQKRLNYTKASFIILAIWFVNDIIVRILALVMSPDLEAANPGDHVLMFFFSIQMVYYSLHLILAITSIILLLIGFLKLFEQDNSEIKNNIKLTTILLVSYIGSTVLFHFITTFLTAFTHFEYYLILNSIMNIIFFVIMATSFFLMNKAIKEISVEMNSTKVNYYAFYLFIVTGLAHVIFHIIYTAISLPGYSLVILFSLQALSIIFGCVEFVNYLNSLNVNVIPNQKIEQNEI